MRCYRYRKSFGVVIAAVYTLLCPVRQATNQNGELANKQRSINVDRSYPGN